MKVRAVRLGAGLPVLAGVQLIVIGMILLLLPAVALAAAVLVRAAVLIVVDELAAAPVEALVLGVKVELRLSSVVLPVVGEDALVSLVVVFVVGTPDGLKVKHVEVRVELKLINKLHRYFSLRVSERAVLPIFAFLGPIDVGGAELRLVFVRVVKLLYPVVGLLAELSLGALSVLGYEVAHLGLIGAERPSLILLLVMVVGTPLQVVATRVDLAGLDLEQGEVQELTKGLTATTLRRLFLPGCVSPLVFAGFCGCHIVGGIGGPLGGTSV